MIAGNSAIRRAAIEVPCHDRKLYVAIIIKRLLFTETAAAGVFVTALSISMTSTFCGQSWLRGSTRGHVDILSVIRDNFFADAEYTFLCISICETAFMSRQSRALLNIATGSATHTDPHDGGDCGSGMRSQNSADTIYILFFSAHPFPPPAWSSLGALLSQLQSRDCCNKT